MISIKPSPTGTPLNVRRFDGKIIGALQNGEIVRILRTGADPYGKPWAYVAYETNGEGWVYREFTVATGAVPLPTSGRDQAGAGANAGSSFGKGLKVDAIRKAPIPIAQEPT